jgi:hypothetical protein
MNYVNCNKKTFIYIPDLCFFYGILKGNRVEIPVFGFKLSVTFNWAENLQNLY